MAQFIGIANTNEKPKPVGFRRLAETFYDPYLNGTGELFDDSSKSEATGQDASNYELGARLVQAFSDMEKLEDDWNTYGAPAPSNENIELARRICSLFPRKLQPEISPEVDGSIGLYWDLDLIYSIIINKSDCDCPKFTIETYDGEILVDEEFVDSNLNIDQLAAAFRRYLTQELNK